MRRPSISIVFIYSLTITLLAFTYRSTWRLAVIGLLNGAAGIYYGKRYRKLILLLLALSVWGTFLDALAVSNTGPIAFALGPLTVRRGVLTATANIGLRLTAIAGAALLFAAPSDPRSIVRGLEEELHMPSGLAFSLAYALRLIPLMRRDLGEIQLARLERGYRKTPLTPRDMGSLIMPLLSVAYERASWAGISAELRGFGLRKPRRRKIRVGMPEIAVLSALAAQIIIPLLLP